MSKDNEIDTFVYHDYEPDYLNDGQFESHGSHSNTADITEPVVGDSQGSFNNNYPSQNISFSIPGAFKENDYMEVDDSPPFTIESDLYFDSQSNNNNQIGDYETRERERERETLFPHNQYFIRQFKKQTEDGGYRTVNEFKSTEKGFPSQPFDPALPYKQDGYHNPEIVHNSEELNPLDFESQLYPFEHNNQNEVSPNSNGFLSNVNTPNPSYRQQFDPPASVSGSMVNTSSYFNEHIDQFDENSLYSGIVNEDGEQHLRNASIDSHFNGPHSLTVNSQLNPNAYVNELSPLTTTTSMTHSVNSIYSNQPSFFSAHQYLSRPSVELNGSNRTSVDHIAKNRNSIDSGTSSQRQPRNNNRYLSFTNSITNYIPFMSDKNNQRSGGSPGSVGPPSPISNTSGTAASAFMNSQPTPRQQPKHLIRSIFKSNPNNQSPQSPQSQNSVFNPLLQVHEEQQMTDFDNEQPEPESAGEEKLNDEFLVLSPENGSHIPEAVQNKKIKKQKRSLFTRFKTPAKPEEEQVEIDDSSKHSHNSIHEEDGNEANQSYVSRTPSSANTVRTNLNNNVPSTQQSSQGSSVHNLEPAASDPTQPNYAALFENVRKRKKPKSNFKKKKNEKVESDIEDGEDESDVDSSLNNDHSITEKVSFDSVSASTSNTSHDPSIKIEGEDESSMLTNASKRILGSKLMKRKGLKKQAELRDIKTKLVNEGIEVEVDLKTLDLPDTTQAFPTSVVNSKSRTRGRKENKQADLSDTTKIYLCNYCSRRFKRQEHLKRHFRSLHTFEKPYDCSVCHKKFSRSDNLNQHLKTHKEDGTLGDDGTLNLVEE